MSAQHRNALMFFAVLFALEAGPPVSAQETEVTLNQNKAISGGVTPGDRADSRSRSLGRVAMCSPAISIQP